MRAWVVGNTALDEYFSVPALPSAGESLRADLVQRCLGGKGANQAIVLARCGIDTTFLTVIGDDDDGRTLYDTLAAEPLKFTNLKAGVEVSDQSLICVNPSGENTILSTTAAARSIDAASAISAMAAAQASDWLVLQGNMSFDTTAALLRHARDLGLTCAFNPSPINTAFGELLPMSDCVFVNAVEARAFTGVEHREAVRHLLDSGVRCPVVTHGDKGVAYCYQDALHVQTSTPVCNVVDTTAAGDTLMATAIASAMHRQCVIDHQALRIASRAAAISVGRFGAYTALPTHDELMSIFEFDN